MGHFRDSDSLKILFHNAEQQLLNQQPLKFCKDIAWRTEHIPNGSGVYALFENESLLYIGETGNLRDRMSDLCRTVNHSFRKQLGARRYNGTKSRKKYSSDIEAQLDCFYEQSLYVSFIEVNFGRLEIETHLVTKYQTQLINSVKRRK